MLNVVSLELNVNGLNPTLIGNSFIDLYIDDFGITFLIFIPHHTIVSGGVLLFQTITYKYQWIFTKLDMCIDIVEIWFGSATGQISSIFDRVICPPHFHIFFSG